MNLNLTIKAAVGAVLLSAGAIPAFAQTIPTSGPTPEPGLGAGGLIVYVWDATTNTSLAEWLGGDSTTFGTPAATVAGTNLNYGILGGSTTFNSLFSASEVAAGDVQYIVTAVNAVSSGTPTADFTAVAGTPLTTTRNSALVTFGQNINTGISSVMDGPSACNNLNPCTATSTTAATYAGAYLALTKIGNMVIDGTAGGAALNFYQVVSPGGNNILAPTQFAAGANTATWTLSATGDLVYNVAGAAPVPLPPALWLLGSGLLGLAGIARRKTLTA
jgi:hypothetical protein